MARFRNFGPQRKRRASGTLQAAATRGRVTPRSGRATQGVTKPISATPRRLLLPPTANRRAWQLTENWIVSIAEPRFANAIKEAIGLTEGDVWAAIQRHYLNPIDITYYILQGEIPSTKIPLRVLGENRYNFLNLQADDPKLETYYSDKPTLDLYRRVHRRVETALLRLRRARKGSRVLLFPL